MEKNAFMGLNGFIWWIGVVESRMDPLHLGRCQIRIFGWHTDNKTHIDSTHLPWAQPLNSINNSSFKTPLEGDWVFGFYLDGEAGQFPVYLGKLPSIPMDQGNIQKGFYDPRSNTELALSPAFPKFITSYINGIGSDIQNQSASNYPIELDFPTTNKLAINSSNNQSHIIVQRKQSQILNIVGPSAVNPSETISAGYLSSQCSDLFSVNTSLRSPSTLTSLITITNNSSANNSYPNNVLKTISQSNVYSYAETAYNNKLEEIRKNSVNVSIISSTSTSKSLKILFDEAFCAHTYLGTTLLKHVETNARGPFTVSIQSENNVIHTYVTINGNKLEIA